MQQIYFFLFLKHFIIDFLMQTPYQYKNKGIYGHFGGILHALLHCIGTFIIIVFFTDIITIMLILFFEFIIHYHVDWMKICINKKFNFNPNTHERFWWLLGFDQYLHLLTYWLIVGYIFMGT